jgi:hypothetical protein
MDDRCFLKVQNLLFFSEALTVGIKCSPLEEKMGGGTNIVLELIMA